MSNACCGTASRLGSGHGPRVLVLAAILAAACLSPASALALQKIAPEIGYVITSEREYGAAPLYGVSVIEGTGRIGMGFSFLTFSASNISATSTEVGVYRHKQSYSEMCLTIMGTWMAKSGGEKNLLVVGLGPQIHFLKAIRQHIDQGYSETARDSRLGVGITIRYEKLLPAFGSTTFVMSARMSWMESGIETIDFYSPPAGSMVAGGVTLGLAFPF
jgi:hypothetical protein